MIEPGERTGKFRLGGDVIFDSNNKNSISFEDYAIALVDELEKPERTPALYHRILIIGPYLNAHGPGIPVQ